MPSLGGTAGISTIVIYSLPGWLGVLGSNGSFDYLYFHVYVFLRKVIHFLTDMSNRVEHQKLNQVAPELPPDKGFSVKLGLL